MNYDKAYQLVSYVESLPPNTRFDYLNPESCLFGHYRKSAYACGTTTVDAIGHSLGMDKSQLCWFYGGLIAHEEFGKAVQFDRLAICKRARAVLARWEADEAMEKAAKQDSPVYMWIDEVRA